MKALARTDERFRRCPTTEIGCGCWDVSDPKENRMPNALGNDENGVGVGVSNSSLTTAKRTLVEAGSGMPGPGQ